MKTKTLYFFSVLFTFAIVLNAQNKLTIDDISSELLYKTINDSKSGNFKDVLTDFMQASIQNITGEDKSISFKATLFSLKSKADSTLLYDYNYVNERFSRNFQFDIGLNLDEDYKFDGFKYGFTYAVINKRDSTVVSLASKEPGEWFRELSSDLIFALNQYRNKFGDNDNYKELKKIIEDALEEEYYVPIESLPKEFVDLLPKNYRELSEEFTESYQNELDKIKRQPLLTVSFNSNFQKDSKFLDFYDVEMIYLHGIKSKITSMEIDFRARVESKDSTVTNEMIKRNVFTTQVGLNMAVVKKGNISIVEFKPNIEYKNIFKGMIEGEKESQFFANADLRIRLTKNLWIPLIVKYDLESNNLFGFLNVNFNFDSFKD